MATYYAHNKTLRVTVVDTDGSSEVLDFSKGSVTTDKPPSVAVLERLIPLGLLTKEKPEPPVKKET